MRGTCIIAGAPLVCFGTRSLVAVLLVLFTVGQAAFGDFWVRPKVADYPSESGQYVFRVTPVSSKPGEAGFAYGTCRGALYHRKDGELALQWERPLINNVAPCGVYVADSGKCVVTIADWYSPGFLPVVLYGFGGELIRVHGSLDQIMVDSLPRGRLFDPGTFEKEIWFSKGLFFFTPDQELFVMRLWRGDVLMFDAEDGTLMDEKWKEHYRVRQAKRQAEGVLLTDRMRKYEAVEDNLNKMIVYHALRSVSSCNPDAVQRMLALRAGEHVLRQSSDEESVRLLHEVMRDPTSRIIERDGVKVREYFLRKAAKTALESMGEPVSQNVHLEQELPNGDDTRGP